MNERANSQGDGDEADAGCDGLDLGIPALDRHPSHQLERCRSQDSRSGSDKFIKVVDTRNDRLANYLSGHLSAAVFGAVNTKKCNHSAAYIQRSGHLPKD